MDPSAVARAVNSQKSGDKNLKIDKVFVPTACPCSQRDAHFSIPNRAKFWKLYARA